LLGIVGLAVSFSKPAKEFSPLEERSLSTLSFDSVVALLKRFRQLS
jgi:hypothetical protein